jgi:predicted N-formylglutamate amidohydrolase
VDTAERRRRQERYFDPYHDAIDRTIRARKAVGAPVRLCSIHSFTPLYLGRARPMEVGVLFDEHDEYAWRLEGALAEQGFEAILNAPYSGREGMMYAAQRHGTAREILYLELEVRQDMIETREKALATARRIARALACCAPPLVAVRGPDLPA